MKLQMQLASNNFELFDKTFFKRLYIFRDKNIVWLSNPKVASTSIKYFLIKNWLKEDGEFSIHGKNSPLYEYSGLFLNHLDEFDEILKTDNFTFFCVVRDPLSRLVSGYENKILTRKGKKIAFGPKKQILSHILGRVPDYNELDTQVSFNDYVSAILEIDQKDLNEHFVCQSYLTRVDVIKNVQIFKQEDDLDEPFFIGKDKEHRVDLTNISFKKSKKVNARPHPLSKTNLDLFFEKYRSDYDAFNYTPKIPSSLMIS